MEKNRITHEAVDAYKDCKYKVGFLVGFDTYPDGKSTTWITSEMNDCGLSWATALMANGIAHLICKAVDNGWLSDAESINRFLADLSGEVLCTLSNTSFCDTFRKYKGEVV